MNDLHLTLSDVPNIALTIGGFTISILILCNWRNNYWSRTIWGGLAVILLVVANTSVLTRAIMGNYWKANGAEWLYDTALVIIFSLDAVIVGLALIHVHIENKRAKDARKKFLEEFLEDEEE